jgi:hypothetical protein
MYHAVEVVYLVAILSTAAVVARAIVFRRLRNDPPQWPTILALGACMLAALAYHATVSMQTQGTAGTMGYYLFAIAPAEAILLTCAWPRLQFVIVPMFAALELFGAWFVQFPYYAGLTQHGADGRLPAARVSQLGYALFENLAVNTPFGPVAIVLLALGSVAATLLTVALSISLARSRPVSTAVAHDAKPPA